MTKQEAIEELRKHLEVGESITVERTFEVESLSNQELLNIFDKYPGTPWKSIRAVVIADRKREVERMRFVGFDDDIVADVAKHLGVEE